MTTGTVLDAVALSRRAFPRGGLVALDAIPQQVLLAVAEAPRSSVTALKERLHTHQSSVSAALTDLQQAGLVRDARRPGERRPAFVPTAEGRRKVDSFLSRV